MVLPGLDQALDDAAWDAVDETHPQFGLKRLLARIGIARDAVAPWPTVADRRLAARNRLVSEGMRPAATTDRWRDARRPAVAIDRRGRHRRASTVRDRGRKPKSSPW